VEHVQAVTLKAANDAICARISEKDLVASVVGTHPEIGAAIAGAIPELAETTVDPFDLE
jgi:hypothetical protein